MGDVVANVRSEGCDKLAKENALLGEDRIHFEESRHIYWVRLNDQTIRVAKSVTSLKAQLFDEFDSDAVIKKNMPKWASNSPWRSASEYGQIVHNAVGNDTCYITSDNLEVISFFIANKTTFNPLPPHLSSYEHQDQAKLLDKIISTFASEYAQALPLQEQHFGVQYPVGFQLQEGDFDLVDVNAFNFWKNIEPNFMDQTTFKENNYIQLTPSQKQLLLTQCSWVATFYAYQRAKQAILTSWSKKTHCGTLFHLYVERIFNDVSDLTAPAGHGIAPLATFDDIKSEIQ